MMKMNYESFLDNICDNILYYLPESFNGSDVKVHQITKNNGKSNDALIIRKPGEEIVPTISLDNFYNQYKIGRLPADIMREISTIRMEHESIQNKAADIYGNLSEIKDKIIFKVIGFEANRDMLQNMPHKVINDMAITYHLMFDSIKPDVMASSPINNEFMEYLGISPEELHASALENSQNMLPAEFKSMNNVISSIIQDEPELQYMVEELSGNIPMFILTNSSKINGASTLFYPNQLDNIKSQIKSDFYVLPSSVHEVIIVPQMDGFNYRFWEEMVKDINTMEVPPEEVLTNNVYFCDGNELVIAKDYEHQIETYPSNNPYIEISEFMRNVELHNPANVLFKGDIVHIKDSHILITKDQVIVRDIPFTEVELLYGLNDGAPENFLQSDIQKIIRNDIEVYSNERLDLKDAVDIKPVSNDFSQNNGTQESKNHTNEFTNVSQEEYVPSGNIANKMMEAESALYPQDYSFEI